MTIGKKTKFTLVILGIIGAFMVLCYTLINAGINTINAVGISLIISVFILTGFAILITDAGDKDNYTYELDSECLELFED